MKIKVDISDLLGKEFKMFGTGPDYYDCWGLVREISKRAGQELPELKSVMMVAAREAAIMATAVSFFKKLKRPEPFCLVTFRVGHGQHIDHIGIVLNDVTRFCHIIRGSNVSIERLNLPIWRNKVEGFYRYNGRPTG